jgi:hypothetical protein
MQFFQRTQKSSASVDTPESAGLLASVDSPESADCSGSKNDSDASDPLDLQSDLGDNNSNASDLSDLNDAEVSTLVSLWNWRERDAQWS